MMAFILIFLKGFICPQCMASLTSIEELHRHWEKVHNDDTDMVCMCVIVSMHTRVHITKHCKSTAGPKHYMHSIICLNP